MADIQITQLPSVPIMYWRKFADVVGLEEGVLRGLMEKEYLPSVVFGRHRFINLAKLTQQCLTEGDD